MILVMANRLVHASGLRDNAFRSSLSRISSMVLHASGWTHDALSSLLFPRDCPGCAQSLPFPEVICDPCANGLKKVEPPFCQKCGTPMPQHWRVEVCPECKGERSALSRIRSAYHYEGLVRQMIRDVKYRHRPRYLRFFACMMYPMICAEFPRSLEAIVPVPLHAAREWDRRFNQAALLAQELSRLSGIRIRCELRKTSRSMSQSSLSGIARRKNLRGVFECHFSGKPPRSVLLIDDIITTGTTLTRCAAALRRAGVRRVYATTIARAVKQSR